MEFHAEGYACGTLHVLSYLFLLKYWLRLCRKRKLVWWQEYGVVVLTVPVWCLLTMWVIRFLMGVSLDLYDVPIPAIVSMLLGGFFYIFLRNQMIQKENEAQRLQLEKIKMTSSRQN